MFIDSNVNTCFMCGWVLLCWALFGLSLGGGTFGKVGGTFGEGGCDLGWGV